MGRTLYIMIENAHPCKAYKVKTPDGTMFVVLVRDRKTNKPKHIEMYIGKNGGSLQAWANALGRVVNVSLEAGIPIIKIIECVSQISTDRLVSLSGGVNISSGPAGLSYALLKILQSESQINVDNGSLGEA